MLNLEVPFNDPSRYFSSIPDLQSLLSAFVKQGEYLGGREVIEFEDRFAKSVGVEFCVGVSSGTSALELAITALNLPKGSKILTAANAGGYASFAIKRAGCMAVYVDTTHTGLMDLLAARKLLAEAKISAVIITHLYGQMQNLVEFVAVCRSMKIKVIEDCAQAAGSSRKNQTVGRQGDLSTFSFYPTKNLSTFGDAGAVCSSDNKLIGVIRSLREYGWSKTRYFSELEYGANFRMDSIHAIILSKGLETLDSRNLKRLEIFHGYCEAIKGKDMQFLVEDEDSFVAHLAVLRTKEPRQLAEYLNKHGVQTAVHYPYPDYVQPGIAQPNENFKLSITEDLSRSILSIPCFPEMSENEVLHVTTLLGSYSE